MTASRPPRHAAWPDTTAACHYRSFENAGALVVVAAGRLIAFAGVGGVSTTNIECLHAAGARATLGTLGAADEEARRVGPAPYERLLKSGVDVLATDYVRGATTATAAAAAQ